MKEKVSKALSGVLHFSFMTNVWSTCVSNESLLSLTAHWTHSNMWVLCIQDWGLGAYITDKIKEILESWSIYSDQVHVIVHDNGSNIMKPDLRCFAPSLQLVVHNGVLSQRAVIDILAICMSIVGHFKHSSLVYSKLCEIQQRLSLPQHQLKQLGGIPPSVCCSPLHVVALTAYSFESTAIITPVWSCQ